MNTLNLAVTVIVLVAIVAVAVLTEGMSLPFSLPMIAVMLSRLGVKT
jgi:hypothetical protein